MSQTQPIHALLTHPGRVRRGNEDFADVANTPGLHAFVVCDGLGGAAAGEVASHLAASTFLDHLTSPTHGKPRPSDLRKLLKGAIQAANTAVHRGSRQASNLKGMGTTLVGLLYLTDPDPPEATDSLPPLPPASTLWLANVGDSRCYRIRNRTLTQLTSDHSFVQEQVRAGQITSDEAALSPMRNLITRAIGSRATVDPDIDELHPLPGDLYLIASDGLTIELSDPMIEQILNESPRPPTTSSLEETCTALIDAANHHGGNDNITVLLAAFP